MKDQPKTLGAMVPTNCRQRLAAEGKPYPRSSCQSCGQFSPKWKECDALIAAAHAEQPPAFGGEPEVFEPHGWAQTTGPAINAFTQEFDIAEEWAMAGYGTVELLNREHVDAEIDRLRGEHQAHVAPLLAEIGRWKSLAANQADRTAVACEMVKEISDERDQLKARIAELEAQQGDLLALRTAVKLRNNTINQLRDKAKQTREYVRVCNKELVAQRRIIMDQASELESLKQALNSLKAERAAADSWQHLKPDMDAPTQQQAKPECQCDYLYGYCIYCEGKQP